VPIKCVRVLTACGGMLTGPNGVIDMRNETRALRWLHTYSSLKCEWNVTVRPGRTIAVEFPVFNVPSLDVAHCAQNYVVVSDGLRATCTIFFHGTALSL